MLRTGAIAVALIVSTVVLTSSTRTETPSVVLVGREGKIAEIPLSDTSRFSLSYRHSVYNRPAVETFEVDDRGGFSLVHVRSPAERTLDYYYAEGRRSSAGGWRRLSLDEPPRFTRLSLIATPTGRRTLVVGNRRLPLYDGREATHVTICIGPSQGCS
jgi:hypothetical protein